MGTKKNKVPAQPTTKTDTGLFGTATTGSFGSKFDPTDFQKQYTGMTEQAILNAQNAINNREIAQEAVDNMNRQYQTDFQNQLLAPALSKGWLRGSTAQDVATVANQDYQNRRYQLVNDELSRQNEQLAEITDECLELSDKLKENVSKINENMKNIGDSTSATSERAAVVKDLLENVVSFCNDNSTMDADSVTQLISILETTISAFSALDDNVSITNESSETINKSINDIISLVGEINTVLGKTEQTEKVDVSDIH